MVFLGSAQAATAPAAREGGKAAIRTRLAASGDTARGVRLRIPAREAAARIRAIQVANAARVRIGLPIQRIRGGRSVDDDAPVSAADRAPSRLANWHAGLPESGGGGGGQRSCPEGTVATLARGHADTVRCLPL